MSESITVELHTPKPGPRRERLVARMWRGISGAFAMGLVLLAIATVAVQWYAQGRGLPGSAGCGSTGGLEGWCRQMTCRRAVADLTPVQGSRRPRS